MVLNLVYERKAVAGSRTPCFAWSQQALTQQDALHAFLRPDSYNLTGRVHALGLLYFPLHKAEGRLRLTLTDHNAVSGGLSGLGDAVVEIVDHHVDLGEHPSVQGSRRDVAFEANDGGGKALVGSCCTIVAERMLDQAPALLSSDVAQLLLGVVRRREGGGGGSVVHIVEMTSQEQQVGPIVWLYTHVSLNLLALASLALPKKPGVSPVPPPPDSCGHAEPRHGDQTGDESRYRRRAGADSPGVVVAVVCARFWRMFSLFFT